MYVQLRIMCFDSRDLFSLDPVLQKEDTKEKNGTYKSAKFCITVFSKQLLHAFFMRQCSGSLYYSVKNLNQWRSS